MAPVCGQSLAREDIVLGQRRRAGRRRLAVDQVEVNQIVAHVRALDIVAPIGDNSLHARQMEHIARVGGVVVGQLDHRRVDLDSGDRLGAREPRLDHVLACSGAEDQHALRRGCDGERQVVGVGFEPRRLAGIGRVVAHHDAARPGVGEHVAQRLVRDANQIYPRERAPARVEHLGSGGRVLQHMRHRLVGRGVLQARRVILDRAAERQPDAERSQQPRPCHERAHRAPRQ